MYIYIYIYIFIYLCVYTNVYTHMYILPQAGGDALAQAFYKSFGFPVAIGGGMEQLLRVRIPP